MIESKYIFMDGKFVDFKNAKVHILTHTLHYGNGAFEGVRAYKTDKGLAIFKLKEHTKRLLQSAKILKLKCTYSEKELNKYQIELLNKNEFKTNAYIRPLIYLGYGVMGINFTKAPVNIAIASWEWGAYLGDDALKNGIKVKVSSFRRNSINSTMSKAKAVGNYLNSQMAKVEALECGYGEALLLDDNGFVSEGSGECFFMVKDNVLITPPNDNSLVGITQQSVIEIANDLGIEVCRRNITRDEVYTSEEAFFTGTAAEITPISSMDNIDIANGCRGKITKLIQDKYFDMVYGRDEKYLKHLTFID
jgi:branched-chain amino acid aminotransferase